MCVRERLALTAHTKPRGGCPRPRGDAERRGGRQGRPEGGGAENTRKRRVEGGGAGNDGGDGRRRGGGPERVRGRSRDAERRARVLIRHGVRRRRRAGDVRAGGTRRVAALP